jgi:prevent-host-death family protein
MTTINMLEAKSNLSRLVEAVETGVENEFVIARNGRPAARLVPLIAKTSGQRLGIAKGKFTMPDDIDADNELIADLFEGRTD